MARPSNTDERRGQIVEGLVRVMARRGYAGASIGDVARAARLSPGLVHYHFESKQAILLAALAGLVGRHEARLAARLAAAGDPVAEVGAFLDAHLAVGADADAEALACWVLMSGEALREAKVRAPFRKALVALAARLRGMIERGVAAGVFVCDAPAAAAGALVAAIQGYFALSATAREVVPVGSAAGAARAMAAGLLACPALVTKAPASSRSAARANAARRAR